MIKNKKGFSTLELIVFVAITIVLSVMLFTTYSKISKKANTHLDVLFAQDLNEGIKKLQLNSLETIVDFIFDDGYNETLFLTKQSNHHFVYDKVNNQIMLLEKNDIIYSPSSPSSYENWYVLVVESLDFNVLGNRYVCKDLVLNVPTVLNADYDIILNEKTITAKNLFYIKDDSSSQINITQGTIKTPNFLVDSPNSKIIQNSNVNIIAENFHINSYYEMQENSMLKITEKLTLDKNSHLKVCDNYTLILPFEIKLNQNVRISSSIFNEEIVENNFDFINKVGKFEGMHIYSENDLISEKGNYSFQNSVYILHTNLQLNQHIKIYSSQKVVLYMFDFVLDFDANIGIENLGKLCLIGEGALIKSRQYGIYNKDILSINNVNIEMKNTEYIIENVGIINNTDNIVCEITGSTIKADVGIENMNGMLIINQICIEANKYSIFGSGEIYIGINFLSEIILNGILKIIDAERDIVIGQMGSSNQNIKIEEIIVENPSENYKNYIK